MIAHQLNVEVECNIDPSLIRPNDNRKIIGSFEKLHTCTGWKPIYKLEDSLADIINYWKNIKNIQ